ncbi:MAG: hypothetical protein ACXVEE_26595 [Polyangiales bacterium]
MDLVVRRVVLVMSLACAGCSESAHAPSAGNPFEPGISGDASIAPSDSSETSVTTDAAEDLARDITWIDADSSCTAFCACMSTTCVTEASYPFPDVASCESWCSKRSDLERTCFARFCVEASTTKGPAIKTHDCEHAAGAWGLLECM